MYQKTFPITLLDHITLYRINYLYSPFRNRSFCNNCNIQHLTVYNVIIICILVIKSYNNFYFELEKPVQSDNT